MINSHGENERGKHALIVKINKLRESKDDKLIMKSCYAFHCNKYAAQNYRSIKKQI